MTPRAWSAALVTVLLPLSLGCTPTAKPLRTRDASVRLDAPDEIAPPDAGMGGSDERLDARADAAVLRDMRPNDVRSEAGPNAPVDAPADRSGPDGVPGCGVPADGTGRGLRGEYYDTQDFKQLKFVRIDGSLNVDWAAGGPDISMESDTFSVRWSGQVQPRFTGLYTFYVLSDEGVRLSVNGQMVVDHFMPHQSTEDSGTIMLTEGQKYEIRVEYFEGTGAAAIRLAWSSSCQPKEVIPSSQLYPPTVTTCGPGTAGAGTGLRGEYFDNADLTSLKVTRTDPQVDFDFGSGSPDPFVGADTFSVRWAGQVVPRFSGDYTFYTSSDDGARLYIDDRVVIDNWSDHGVVDTPGTIKMQAGQKYDLRLEYYDNQAGALIRLAWESECQPRQIVPSNQLAPVVLPPACPSLHAGTGTGLKGEYFAGTDLANLRVVRLDPTVSFDFMEGSPDPMVPADGFSARWTGQVQARHTGPYTFYVVADDGARLSVNGRVIIDNNVDHGPVENAATVDMTVDQKYELKLEYHDTFASALARLLWSSDCFPKEVIPAEQLYPAPGIPAPDAAAPVPAPDAGAPDAAEDSGGDR
jgi:hypothetical protein